MVMFHCHVSFPGRKNLQSQREGSLPTTFFQGLCLALYWDHHLRPSWDQNTYEPMVQAGDLYELSTVVNGVVKNKIHSGNLT